MQSIKNIIHLVVSLLIVQLPHLKIYSIVNIYTNKTCFETLVQKIRTMSPLPRWSYQEAFNHPLQCAI